MKLVKVADIAEQIRGVSYAKGDASSSPKPGLVPILRAGNITTDGLTFEDLVYVPERCISKKQLIRQHDIVIAASSGSLDIVGKAARARENIEASFGAFCKVLRPNSNIEPRYFGHYFQTLGYRRIVSKLAAGLNINNLRNEHLDNLDIPLPPLEEQRRIADILDRADALRAKRRAALAKLDTLTQSIFLEIFGDPATNPKGWDTGALKNCTALVQIGPFGSLLHKNDYVDNGIPVINPKHIVSGKLVPSANETVCEEKYEDLKSYQLQVGDIVMGRRGEMGRCALIDDERHLLCGTGSLIIRPDNFHTLPHYTCNLLSSPQIKLAFERASLGQTLPNLNSSIVEKFLIPIPPRAVQQAFSKKVELIEQLKSDSATSFAAINSLILSLQHRVFQEDV